MSDPAFLVDGSELLADAITRFADALGEGKFDLASSFAELAFYLIEHRIEVEP